jgi:hypothetical protein
MNERRDDWRTDLESRTVANTTSIGQIQDTLDDIKETLEDLDHLLRGDPSTDRAGLSERMHTAETKLEKCHTVLFVGDLIGDEKSLIEQFKALRRLFKFQEKSKTRRWIFYGVVAAGLLGILQQAVSIIPQVESWWAKPSVDSVTKKIEAVKHPKSRHRHYQISVPPPESNDDNESQSGGE